MAMKIRKRSAKRKREKDSGNLSEKKKIYKAKTLRDFYGALERGIDGLAYQKEMRHER